MPMLSDDLCATYDFGAGLRAGVIRVFFRIGAGVAAPGSATHVVHPQPLLVRRVGYLEREAADLRPSGQLEDLCDARELGVGVWIIRVAVIRVLYRIPVTVRSYRMLGHHA